MVLVALIAASKGVMNSRRFIRSPRRQARAALVGMHSLFMAFGDGLAPLVRIWRNLYRGLMSI